MFRNFLSVFLLGIATLFVVSIDAWEAIVNGNLSGVHQFAYQVTVQLPSHRPKCGGGIIGDKFILTAAHCIVKDGHIDKRPWVVIAGTNNLHRTADPAVTIAVKKIFVPKEYSIEILGGISDIAVLMLSHSFKFSSNVKKLSLPKQKDENYTGKLAMIAGFGWDNVQENDNNVRGSSDKQMRYAVAEVLDYFLRGEIKHRVPKNHLVAKIVQRDMAKPRGTCVGDSGGPLVVGETVVGILSMGIKDCNEIETGSIYTRVSRFLEFIHHAVNDKHHDNIITANLLN